MTKYELSLTKDYVPSWTLTDAVREFFQNALDQQTVMKDNHMFWYYNEDNAVFSIGNKHSILEPKSLLLGSTSKADDESTIGQFGEGYKVATLVLLRLGKTVKIYNYGAKEVWTPRFSKSRKYGTEILVFDVDKKYPWTSVPDNNLTIEIGNITEEESFEIGSLNLHMQEGYSYYETQFGNILLEKDLRGQVFVNGLHVCNYNNYNYGYDFKAEHIKLDRDRKLISDFNLEWLASKMWAIPTDDEMKQTAVELIGKGAADTKYVKSTLYITNDIVKVANEVHKSFKASHGPHSIPVTSTQELGNIPKGYTPIIVNEQVKELVEASETYEKPVFLKDSSLEDRLVDKITTWAEEWFDVEVSELAKNKLSRIIKEEVDTDETVY